MPAKGHRGANTSGLRTHSRSSSATKVTSNLQLTQREPHQPKLPDKPKKNGLTYDQRPALPRVASNQRVHSRDHLPHPNVKPAPLTQRANGTKTKPGFTLSSASNDDDEDEWISSESGAATPNQEEDSGSDVDSGAATPVEEYNHIKAALENRKQVARDEARRADALLPRVATARPADYDTAPRNTQISAPQPSTQMQPQKPPVVDQAMEFPRSEHEGEPPNAPARTDPNASKRSSVMRSSPRPLSAHSGLSRADATLRPHPLFRAPTLGAASHPPRPSPLAPLAVIPDSSAQLSSSPPSNLYGGPTKHLSTSPSSLFTSHTSPSSPEDPSGPSQRRTSISSARSVATLPVISTLREQPWSSTDRHRTLSTVSQSSSSAALSSLAHLPSVTRPPSPQPVSFFPPVNPYANVEGIHPLLPGPYLNNHLTVLVRRTPFRESFDRVMRAKQAK